MKKRIYSLYCITLLGFLIGVHGGKIALWVGDDPQPAKVFPYSVSLLPEADREKLEKGIYCKDKEELYRLVEDYLS